MLSLRKSLTFEIADRVLSYNSGQRRSNQANSHLVPKLSNTTMATATSSTSQHDSEAVDWPSEILAIVPADVLDEHHRLDPHYKELWDVKFQLFSAWPDINRPEEGSSLPKEMASVLGLLFFIGKATRSDDNIRIVDRYGTQRFGKADWLTALARKRFRAEQSLMMLERVWAGRGHGAGEGEEKGKGDEVMRKM